MSTPINGETFLPALLVEYLEAQRAALGLPDELNLYAWPYLGEMERPFIGIEATTFRFDAHPATQLYDVSVLLDYGVDGEPAPREDAAAAKVRRDAMLTTENTILAKIRAAFSLRTSQQITFEDDVDSLFTWAAARTSPDGEDYWRLEEFVIAAGGGSIGFNAEKRIRTRVTNYQARLMTNEFTV